MRRQTSGRGTQVYAYKCHIFVDNYGKYYDDLCLHKVR